MRRKPPVRMGYRSVSLMILVALVPADRVAAQNHDPLRVQADVARGPYLVGQGFELRVGVIAGAQRPRVDTPRIAGARAWTIGTEVRPVTATGIGSVVAQESRFVFRFRVVPTRAGTLEIPAIQARLNGRSGRSQPRSLSIQALPLQGRPADFLGGVGRFELQAEAVPRSVRVGQEFDFRIKVTGPAAWGMTDRPDLARFGRLKLGLRIEPKPDELIEEPPARTFVYRLRPTQAGEAVLPPVAIAAYDPTLARYLTRVTTGVAIRVVAVPAFDPATLPDDPPTPVSSWPARLAWAVGSLAILVPAVYFLVRRHGLRLARSIAFGPEQARRFARKTARSIGSISVETAGLAARPSTFRRRHFRPAAHFSGLRPNQQTDACESENLSPEPIAIAARRIYALLTRYLWVGTGRSAGVLTPDEARQGVVFLTNSDELGRAAADLTARCDVILYGEVTRDTDEERSRLLDDARTLFEALGSSAPLFSFQARHRR